MVTPSRVFYATFKHCIQAFREAKGWKPDHLRLWLMAVADVDRNRKAGYSDDDHLVAVVRWLEQAQDVTGDGGVSGRYHLQKGWTSSYPETTGYIVPTLLKLAEVRGEASLVERAARCVRFLLSTQLESGAFPGGEIAENRSRPSPFNSAQIIHGLIAWHRRTGEDRVLDAAARAGDWLLSVQDTDGAYRKYFYDDIPATYSAHLSCWLAELGQYTGDGRYLNAAGRHLDWVLGNFDRKASWFDRCGFSEQQHRARTAFTHTIAYTIFGVLSCSLVLGREDGVDAARQAALRALRRCELSGGSIAGVLNSKWQAASDFICLTGNAQFALIWFRLYELDNDLRYLNAAIKAIEEVKRAQPMQLVHPGLRGGIPGSFPVWGDYIPNALPNWAAKFFIDALLCKQKILSRVPERQWQGGPVEINRTIEPPPAESERIVNRPVVVFYTSADSLKPAQVMEASRALDFKPAAMIITHKPQQRFGQRLKMKLRQDGLGGLSAAVLARVLPGRSADDGPLVPGELKSPEQICRERGIRVYHVRSVNDPNGLQLIAGLKPDIALNLGGGILGKAVLDIPKFATLNAHMGLLPYYRGMNVTEWAALNGDPVGCTVHHVDPGIDTGRIIATRTVKPAAANIDELRDIVDRMQIDLLAEVIEWIEHHHTMPATRAQEAHEGVQFFRMCGELRHILNVKLKGSHLSRTSLSASQGS